jgi:hypothetical protein
MRQGSDVDGEEPGLSRTRRPDLPQQVRRHDPVDGPLPLLIRQADDPCIAEADDPGLGIAAQEEAGQAVQEGEMPQGQR